MRSRDWWVYLQELPLLQFNARRFTPIAGGAPQP
jgi:hypothetical protein